ncbi:hypothetical protein [Dyella ginsengisoli]|uniref:hypothetical protein n=1 Tax=Dyella ginsengisoli TaxID=363848 RepID=UPI000348B287|nr:hypothetical protein [Dyella ginsengisoli]
MNKPPVWFYVVATAALLWNLAGCVAFVADLQLGPDDIVKLPEAQQALYRARPVWALVATGVAVIGGALGCLCLLLRKRWATGLLIASLLGVLAQDVGLFVMLDGLKATGGLAQLLQGAVLLIAIGLVPLAGIASARGWTA